ncbi:MAG TPA: YfcE family phosphodiesterase [Pirellulales bacterium]|nr:YfcE family phosphodiesterase [Pirellulales bacterium]
MRIGVVSDTHGHVLNTYQAVRMLESLDVKLVIHCGDIGSADIVRLFDRWPTHFVLGNVDHDQVGLEAVIRKAGKNYHGRFGSLELAEKKIAFLHGDDTALLRQTSTSGEWHLVCHGHTHVAKRAHEGQTLVLNPGALYRATPHSLAYVELPSLEATIVSV